jgi:hypothetical protein
MSPGIGKAAKSRIMTLPSPGGAAPLRPVKPPPKH